MNRHNEGHRERKLPVEREAQEEDLARRRRQMMRMRQEKRRKRRIRVYTLLGAGTVAILAACVGIAGELSWKRYGECGLGHFHVGLFDMLGNMRKEIFEAEARIHEI